MGKGDTVKQSKKSGRGSEPETEKDRKGRDRDGWKGIRDTRDREATERKDEEVR